MALPKASDNPFPSVLVVEGTVPSSPPSGDQRLYIDTSDHKLKRVNSSGTVTIVESGGAAADTIWDTKGDIAAATGADAASKLAAGTNGFVLIADSSQTTGLRWGIPALLVNTQTGTTYTLVIGDAGELVTLSNASAITLTVPTNASVAFAVGTSILLAQLGAGQVTVSPAGGVTVNSRGAALKIAGQYGAATLIKTATDIWFLSGDITT